MAKTIWAEKYRPRTLDEYVFQNTQHRDQIQRMIAEGDIPHLLFTGVQGSGKTTLADILVSELQIDEGDILRVNASKETGIDYVRETILNFASSYPLGKLKVVRLEEFDYMSPNAQGMLREVMGENSETCRFICTCNYEHRILPALKSRMQHIHFKSPQIDEVMVRMATILVNENVEFELEQLSKYVDQAYPDLRKIINNMQLNTVEGKLGNPIHDSEGGDYQFKILDLIVAGDIRAIRKLVSEQCTQEQLSEVYEFLYRNLHKHPVFKDQNKYEQAICILAEGLYKHSLVAIPHLNFDATCYRLAQL